MSSEAAALWDRAQKALESARALHEVDPDGAASRAYYAAFYAVCSLFARQGRTFAKHTAVAAAVHRDLVKEGSWHADLGEDYSWLMRLRQTGDYGQDVRVTPEESQEAVMRAGRILAAVRNLSA